MPTSDSTALSRDVVPCPHCCFPVGTHRYVCSSCGSVLPVEFAAKRMRTVLSFLAARTVRRLPRDPAKTLIWALSGVPLLVGPPVAAILIELLQARSQQRVPSGWLIMLAAANILLSLAFWASLSANLLSFFHLLADWLRQTNPSKVSPGSPLLWKA